MALPRQVLITGAGIGGLSAALAVARIGIHVDVLEQAQQLEEAGAGIQLSPNAVRVLAQLGVAERLKGTVVAPEALRVMNAGNGREIVRMPLGSAAVKRYGAPFWVLHRADLQAALLDAAKAHSDITLSLGTRVEDYAEHANGVTVQARRHGQITERHCSVLIGADGLWSPVRARSRSNTGATRVREES